jgi:antitoxin component of RelBE/YafQ-DinJ toxin-antitoxin module
MYVPTPVPRGRLLNMRVNDDEWQRLNRLAEHYGVNVSAVIRMLAKRESAALGLEPKTPSTPPPKPRRKRSE